MPLGFIGMVADNQAVEPGMNINSEFTGMAASGVESVRVPFNWSQADPYPTWDDVPTEQRRRFTDFRGHPYDFSFTDRVMGAAAAHGLDVLPIVVFAPFWDGRSDTPPGYLPAPADLAPYDRYLVALDKRYGVSGAFWHAHPHLRAVPIRRWQLWNEPSFDRNWPVTPAASSYVALLCSGHDAIKQVDHRATIVMAGLANDSWNFVHETYDVPDAKRCFDVVAVHPYTRHPEGIITILEYVRREMARGGDARKPIMVTEFSFPSAQGKTTQDVGIETTEAGQAAAIPVAMRLMAANRGRLNLLAMYHHDWVGSEMYAKTFNFSGLFRYSHGRFVAKPAYGAFRRTALSLERCRQKSTRIATRCLRPG